MIETCRPDTSRAFDSSELSVGKTVPNDTMTFQLPSQHVLGICNSGTRICCSWCLFFGDLASSAGPEKARHLHPLASYDASGRAGIRILTAAVGLKSNSYHGLGQKRPFAKIDKRARIRRSRRIEAANSNAVPNSHSGRLHMHRTRMLAAAILIRPLGFTAACLMPQVTSSQIACHNSALLPSGSMTQANRPNSDFTIFSDTRQPAALSLAISDSRSLTR